MKQTTRIEYIGNAQIKLVSDRDNGEYLDTVVYVGDTQLICVSGDRRLEFLDEFDALVEKYRI